MNKLFDAFPDVSAVCMGQPDGGITIDARDITLYGMEWILPIVCYRSATLAHKRLSMIVAGLICTAVTNRLEIE